MWEFVCFYASFHPVNSSGICNHLHSVDWSNKESAFLCSNKLSRFHKSLLEPISNDLSFYASSILLPDEAESFNLIFDRFEWVVNYVKDSRDTIWYQNCFGNGLDVYKTKVDDLMVTISTCSGPEIKHCYICAVFLLFTTSSTILIDKPHRKKFQRIPSSAK